MDTTFLDPELRDWIVTQFVDQAMSNFLSDKGFMQDIFQHGWHGYEDRTDWELADNYMEIMCEDVVLALTRGEEVDLRDAMIVSQFKKECIRRDSSFHDPNNVIPIAG